ncbi:hypothetical protein AGMMS50268_05230 [Spirochaetia bacterium]|nr:hypothetical protein AGMMS50268_05230 [Spirochaetia bacterium]
MDNGAWKAIEIKKQIDIKNPIGIEAPSGEIKELLIKFYKESSGWRNDIIDWAKKIIPDVIESPDGQVNVSRSSIKNIIAHGKGPLKLLTMPYLSQMLKNGVLYYSENSQDKQGRPRIFYNYVYPLIFEGKEYFISISVKEDYNGQRLYDNEFIQKIKTTNGLNNIAGPSTGGNLTHSPILNILQDIIAVNQDSVSKI